jgi:hypothetical protein
MNATKIVGLADGSAAQDAVALLQMQTAIANAVRGISAMKEPVRAASTANITLATPGASIDSVVMVAGDRFLAKNQTIGLENGIYVWNGAAAPATRALDADGGTELQAGTNVRVAEGTVNADLNYAIISDGAVVIGTTATVWAAANPVSTYTASNGILKTGLNFTGVVDPAGSLLVGAAGFAIDTSVVARKKAVSIGNGSLTVIDHVHNLGTLDVTPMLRNIATGEIVTTDTVVFDTNTVRYTFAVAPTANQYRSVVTG